MAEETPAAPCGYDNCKHRLTQHRGEETPRGLACVVAGCECPGYVELGKCAAGHCFEDCSCGEQKNVTLDITIQLPKFDMSDPAVQKRVLTACEKFVAENSGTVPSGMRAALDKIRRRQQDEMMHAAALAPTERETQALNRAGYLTAEQVKATELLNLETDGARELVVCGDDGRAIQNLISPYAEFGFHGAGRQRRLIERALRACQ